MAIQIKNESLPDMLINNEGVSEWKVMQYVRDIFDINFNDFLAESPSSPGLVIIYQNDIYISGYWRSGDGDYRLCWGSISAQKN